MKTVVLQNAGLKTPASSQVVLFHTNTENGCPEPSCIPSHHILIHISLLSRSKGKKRISSPERRSVRRGRTGGRSMHLLKIRNLGISLKTCRPQNSHSFNVRSQLCNKDSGALQLWFPLQRAGNLRFPGLPEYLSTASG